MSEYVGGGLSLFEHLFMRWRSGSTENQAEKIKKNERETEKCFILHTPINVDLMRM